MLANLERLPPQEVAVSAQVLGPGQAAGLLVRASPLPQGRAVLAGHGEAHPDQLHPAIRRLDPEDRAIPLRGLARCAHIVREKHLAGEQILDLDAFFGLDPLHLE